MRWVWKAGWVTAELCADCAVVGAGCGERNLGRDAAWPDGWRTTSSSPSPLTSPPVPTLRSQFPVSGAGRSFLFIFRCCKGSTSPFAAADLHSYLMSLCHSTSHWFSFWRQQKLRVHRKVEDSTLSERLLRCPEFF